MASRLSCRSGDNATPIPTAEVTGGIRVATNSVTVATTEQWSACRIEVISPGLGKPIAATISTPGTDPREFHRLVTA
jgi:hypothetical protein